MIPAAEPGLVDTVGADPLDSGRSACSKSADPGTLGPEIFGQRSCRSGVRPGQRVRRIFRDKRVSREGCVPPSGDRLGPRCGRSPAQRHPGAGARQGGAEPDEVVRGEAVTVSRPPPARACRSVCRPGLGSGRSPEQPRTPGVCRQAPDVCRAVGAGRGTVAIGMAARGLQRTSTDFVDDIPPAIIETVFSPGAPILDSRKHSLSKRFGFSRDQDEQPQSRSARPGRQGRSGISSGTDRPAKMGLPSTGESESSGCKSVSSAGALRSERDFLSAQRPASGASRSEDAFPDLSPDGRPLRPTELINLSLRFLASGFCLTSFIEDSLRVPDVACNMQAAPGGGSLWPIPPPRSCWSGRGRSSRALRRRATLKAVPGCSKSSCVVSTGKL